MGPKNPEEARENNPDCLRAQFGQSVLDNAVHGSSSGASALANIKELFAEELAAEEEQTEEGQAAEGQEEGQGEQQTNTPPVEETS